MPDTQTAILVKQIIESSRAIRRQINLVTIILVILCTIMAIRFYFNDRSRDAESKCQIKEVTHGHVK